MSDTEPKIACSHCEIVTLARTWTVVQRPNHHSVTNGYAVCPDCGHEENLHRDVIALIDGVTESLTREYLLAEVSRSLRETHPDTGDRIVAEIERRLLPDGQLAAIAAALVHASDVGTQAMNMRSVFREGGPMHDSVRKLEAAGAKINWNAILAHRPLKI